MGNPIARGIEISGDFLGENVRVGKIVGVVYAFVSEPKMSRLVAVASPTYVLSSVLVYYPIFRNPLGALASGSSRAYRGAGLQSGAVRGRLRIRQRRGLGSTTRR